MKTGFLDRLENCLCMILLSLFICLIFLQIILRQLEISLPWTEELARYSFLWFILFGACHAARLDSFNRVVFQLAFFPPKTVPYILIAGDIIWLVFSLVLAWQGFLAVLRLAEYPYYTPGLDWNLQYVYVAFPISFLLMSFRIIQQILTKLAAVRSSHATGTSPNVKTGQGC